MFKYDFNLYVEGLQWIQNQIEAEGRSFDYVVGLARGGAIPAVHLSHRLNIPCRILHWQTRDGDARDGVMLREIGNDLNSDKSILIVDDIFDTGKTITDIEANLLHFAEEEKLNGIMTAGLVYRTDSIFKPDFYHIADPDGWVEYWWEA